MLHQHDRVKWTVSLGDSALTRMLDFALYPMHSVLNLHAVQWAILVFVKTADVGWFQGCQVAKFQIFDLN